MESTRPNTPGLGGYLLAWLVSVVAFATAIVTIGALEQPVPLGERLPLVAGFTVWVGVVSLLLAPWAMPVVHYTCRHLDAQLLHVFTAGVAGAVVGVLFCLLVPGFILFAPYLPLATALGRAAVVPLVWTRRAAWERAREARPARLSGSV